MPLAGYRLLPREAATLLYDRGWTDHLKLVTMIAVAQQESQFYTEAVGGPNFDGSFDYGWLQINSNHSAKFGYDAVSFQQACFDREKSSDFARHLYVEAGYRFTPWSAYTSGGYRQYLGNGVIGAANALGVKLELTPEPYTKKA